MGRGFKKKRDPHKFEKFRHKKKHSERTF